MTAIQVFIPRIVGGISANFLKQSFKLLDVGNITQLDMRSRLNSNNYSYSFAFLTVELFETDFAKKLLQKLKQTGHAQLVYDDYNYWEIKDYIPREKRLETHIPEVTELEMELNLRAVPENIEYEEENLNEEEVGSALPEEVGSALPEWVCEPITNNSITQISAKTREFEYWMNQAQTKTTRPVEAQKCLPAPTQSKFLPLFQSPKCFPKLDLSPTYEPSIQSLCHELLHYRPWTYPQMHIDAEHPAYYPSKHLNNDARDYESIQQDINAIISAQNTYRLF